MFREYSVELRGPKQHLGRQSRSENKPFVFG